MYKKKCELFNSIPVASLVTEAWAAVKTAEVTRSHGVIIDAGIRLFGNKIALKTDIAKELKVNVDYML